ncbi:MAG TPA: DEAD/DEAH box helicase, partial [Bacillota bacterium]|nr:DEAD/DEAH box helicase [Bacillota bacterium]
MSVSKNLTSDSPIRFVKGVGEKRAALFEKLGISTARDLMCFFPRDYVDKTVITHIADALNNEKCTFRVKLMTLPDERTARSGLSYFSFIVADDTGSMSVTVFGQKWLAKELTNDCEYRMYGTLKLEHFAKQLISPVIEKWNDQLLQVVPLYPLTKGFVQKNVTKAVKEVLFLADSEPEIITPEQRAALHLMSRSEAVREMHFPSSTERLGYARKRLAFDELLIFQLGVMSLRKKNLLYGAPVMPLKNTHISSFFKALPFSLTGAQERCIKEIFDDLNKQTPMSRLLQGDVGSGKTVVAAAAAYLCTANSYQCAVMAPTSILAKQHYDTFSKLLEPFGIKCVLLIGSLNTAEKNKVKAQISDGTAQVIIGTHALLYKDVVFASLGLVVTDEQH